MFAGAIVQNKEEVDRERLIALRNDHAHVSATDEEAAPHLQSLQDIRRLLNPRY